MNLPPSSATDWSLLQWFLSSICQRGLPSALLIKGPLGLLAKKATPNHMPSNQMLYQTGCIVKQADWWQQYRSLELQEWTTDCFPTGDWRLKPAQKGRNIRVMEGGNLRNQKYPQLCSCNQMGCQRGTCLWQVCFFSYYWTITRF